ncbi:MAG: pyridoxamine 5'-phosphate oxidase family protein [Chloroflexota bacterium]|nr:pyridoxamine 5'-phosphate oxidase family protein [Chloroflexota bacterium]
MALSLSPEQRQRFHAAPDVWLATVKPESSAHLVPIWAVLVEDVVYMATEPHSQKVRNILAHPRAALALPDTREVLVLEGTAKVLEGSGPPGVLERFQEKYDWRFTPGNSWVLVQFTPDKILGWNSG